MLETTIVKIKVSGREMLRGWCMAGKSIFARGTGDERWTRTDFALETGSDAIQDILPRNCQFWNQQSRLGGHPQTERIG
jgi:hypothetical protein